MKLLSILLLVLMTNLLVDAQVTRVTDELTLETGVEKHSGLDEVYRKFSKAYRDLDSAAFAGIYSSDAAYLVPGNNIQIGGVEIVKSFDDFFRSIKSRDSRLTIAFNIFQRKIDKSMAYDVGVYTLKTFNKDNVEVNSGRGKFVVVALREGTKWKFQVDGYSDMPAEKKKP